MDAAGSPTALHLSFLHFVELIGFRMWGVLFFPINWSSPGEWWLTAGLVLCALGLAAAVMFAQPERKTVRLAILFCIAAILPASHLALLDPTLNRSRVYHLACAGFALFMATVFEGFRDSRVALCVAGCLLCFQAAALSHNLVEWRDTAMLAARVCRQFGALEKNESSAAVEGLPATHKGVYFLTNGFADCVLVNSGKQMKIAGIGTGEESEGAEFRWSEQALSMVRIR